MKLKLFEVIFFAILTNTILASMFNSLKDLYLLLRGVIFVQSKKHQAINQLHTIIFKFNKRATCRTE